MKQRLFEIVSNRRLAPNVFEMVLRGDCSWSPRRSRRKPRLDGFYLRRPISVCNVDGDALTLIYKVVGRGTEAMSRMQSGEKLDALVGLGNGYSLDECGDRPMLIGGGAGVPPMYLLARRLLARGADVTVVLGFNAREDFHEEDSARWA